MPNSRSKQSMLAVLKQRAAAQVAMYPQYNGHFRSYVLCRIRADLKTKMGLAFKEGEVAICDPQVGFGGSPSFRNVWSMRNAVDTSVPSSLVEVIGAKGRRRR